MKVEANRVMVRVHARAGKSRVSCRVHVMSVETCVPASHVYLYMPLGLCVLVFLCVYIFVHVSVCTVFVCRTMNYYLWLTSI